MNQETVNEIGPELAAHFRGADPDELRQSDKLVNNSLAALPDPDQWIVDPDGGGTNKALIIAGNRLIEVRAERDDDAKPTIQVVERPLLNAGAFIDLQYCNPATDARGFHRDSHWVYRWPTGDSVTVTGHVVTAPGGAETPDRNEIFARALAARVGNEPPVR